MFKEWLKQFLAVCICAITILSSFSPAFADDYVVSDSGEDATYYIIEGKDVESLFDFTIYDIDNIVDWMFQFKTYTVIKKYEDTAGTTRYKCYFNTPNLQTIVKNKVTSIVGDGYTDDTYKVEDTQWVVKVGTEAAHENVITKYGFKIPSYTYMGEYPKEVMSTAGILPNPKKWWEVAWRAIKSLFGVSFLQAPNADNFNTITYLNHQYKDKDDYILDFFKLYYLDYFERQIPLNEITTKGKTERYFTGPEEVISMAVTEDAYNAACNYNTAHQDEYNEAVQRYVYWNAYQAGGIENCLAQTQLVGNRKYDSWHFLASIEKYKAQFNDWVKDNDNKAYIMINATLGSHRRYGGSGNYLNNTKKYGFTSPTEYVENTDTDTSISLAADILRYTESSSNFKAHVAYDALTTTRTVTVKTSYQGHTKGDSGWTTQNFGDSYNYGSWSTPTAVAHETDVAYSATEEYRDNPSYINNEHTTNGSWSSGTSMTTWEDSDNDGNEDDGYYETWTEKTRTDTKTYNGNYNIVYLFAKNDKTNTMSYEDWLEFLEVCSFDSLEYDESDFVPALLQGIYDTYLANETLKQNYKDFIEILGRGDDQKDDTKKKELLYRQCMITSESEKDDECWSRKYGDDKTSLSVVQVYAYSRIYTVTEDYPSYKHKLTDADAHEIISKLQAYCGPYSGEVIANMMKIMCATAKDEGIDDPTNTVISDDLRVMPYDTASLLARDRENYGETDPRVELYKTHVIGKLISNFKLNPIAIGIYFKPQKTIVSVAGFFTELSVFMQQLCNFDVLDDYGLSPASMWTSGYVMLMMCLLAVFFIAKTVIAVIKMGTNAGSKILVAFFILVFELGLITATFAAPAKIWGTIKNIENKVINLGEMATVYSIPELTYLYGDATDHEVTYYMPYLDTWSKYNTGYGILADEQLMDDTRDYRELEDGDFPKIGSNEVKHWSVLLMDSFHYWGYSNALANTVTIGGKTYNGPKINNNAYRVVDHFMAPRVTLSDSGDKISMSIAENENYNGEFQSGIVDLIVKLLNCILCCLLSFIKLMTFLWQWFVFYIFIFRVILGRGAEGKPMGRILLETFAPTVSMIMIGLYAGIAMIMGMNASGLIGIFLEIFLFWLTFMMIRWWHDTGRQVWFPQTLIPLYYVTNLSRAQQKLQQDKIQNEAKNQDIQNGMADGYSEMSIEDQRDVLFDENGNRRSEYRDEKYDTQVMNWYNRAKALQGPAYNKQHDMATLRQMSILEQDQGRIGERIKKQGEAGATANAQMTKADKIRKGITSEDRNSIDTNQDLDKKKYIYKQGVVKAQVKQASEKRDKAVAEKMAPRMGEVKDYDVQKPKQSGPSEKERQERVSKMYGDGTPKTGDGPEKKKKPPKIGGVKD